MKTLSMSILLVFCFVLPASAVSTSELASKYAQESGVSENEAREQVKLVFSLIQEELRSGNEVNIRSFGTFHIQEREAREGRNPKTGKAIQIPAKRYPKFRSSEKLKTVMNQK